MRALAEISDSVMSKGPAVAPVTIEFFADLQSAVSRPAVSVLNELMKRYPQPFVSSSAISRSRFTRGGCGP